MAREMHRLQFRAVSSEEVERMKRDAELHAEEDKKWKELVDARNAADQTVYQVEKALKEHGDKISDRDKAPITAAVERVKQAASGEDVQAIQQAISDLHAAAQAMAQHVQGQSAGGPQQQQAPSGDGKGGKEDVIDAEFEVKK